MVSGLVTKLIQIIVITLMSLGASMAFAESGFGESLQKWAKMVSTPVGASFTLIIWGFLFVIGLYTIVIRAKNAGFFAVLAILFSLPTLLTYNQINLLSFVSSDFSFDTFITFNMALVLGMVLIIGYIVLNLTQLVWHDQMNLKKRGTSQQDILFVSTRIHLFLTISIASTILIVTLLVTLSKVGSTLISDTIKPWIIAVISLVPTLGLTIYLFWVGLGDNNSEIDE
jgi:hypothetical protein